MMKKMWKNRSGVSPVIATILMVAITVVLAAVLYVMVMGFGTSSSAPTAALDASATSKTHQEKVVVTSISSAQLYADMKVSIVVDGASKSATIASGDINDVESTTVTEVKFVDLAGDDKVSTGDYFLVTGTGAITLNLLYGEDSTSIATESWNVAA